jgi:hypothetical protein
VQYVKSRMLCAVHNVLCAVCCEELFFLVSE